MTLEKPKLLPAGYKQGPFRPYASLELSPALLGRCRWTPVDGRYAFLVFAIAVVVRFYKLPHPARVVFDETHLGGFAREYYDGEFFVDVHPPLAKLVFYYIAMALGWDGKDTFAEIGAPFLQNTPYVAMRAFSAACGVGTAVLTYTILRLSACRSAVALFGALLTIFENSFATQSRLIMCDSALIFFTALSVWSFKRFQLQKPFSKAWVQCLMSTGFALGLTVSTKLTGLFTLAWVCVLSVYQIWTYLGDVEVPAKQLVGHVAARAFAFLVVPLTMYCGFFSIHFMLLPRNGTGLGIMSPAFKAELQDSDQIRNTAVDVSYGSRVTLKHHRLDTYLHLHNYTYRSGTGEQQVTMYGFSDDVNNEWELETPGTNVPGKLTTRFRPIKDGDTIKLYHRPTAKYLRANDVRPPNSEHDYLNEVSCHGNITSLEDINYEWKVKIIGKKPHSENDLPLRKLRATETVFQLVHRGTQCVLMGHETKLPDWAFHQNQVLCVNDPTLPNTLWYIESNNHPVIDDDWEKYPRVAHQQLLLFQKMVEYHHLMWRINKGFVKEHEYLSLPAAWPFVIRGINYFRGEGNVYLLGNMGVYYGGVVMVVVYLAKVALHLFQVLNPFVLRPEPMYESSYYMTSFEYVLGWALHYVPYMHMTRQLFVHHYLTSVLFLVLVISVFAEYLMHVRCYLGYSVMAAVLLATLLCFSALFPVIYGTSWTSEACERARWLGSWDFDCSAY